MIGAPLKIVEAVRVTLAERVLPQLEAATWLAGDVRSSIALLTYLEDVLVEGAGCMGQANAAMAGFLHEAMVTAPLPDALRDRIAAALSRAEAVAPADLTALEAAGVALRAAMSDMVALRDGGQLADPAIDDRLRETLRSVAEQEQRLAARAGGMTPF